MATAVLPAPVALPLDGGIMAPSPMSPNTARHGRSRAGSKAGKAGRTRGYSAVEARENIISKALNFVLKRTVTQDEVAEQNDGQVVRLVVDADGWVGAETVLSHPNMSALQVTFPELLGVVASPKSRVSIKAAPAAEDDTEVDMEPQAADYLLRQNGPASAREPGSPTTGAPSSASAQSLLAPLTELSEDLPHLVAYETSYANYPLILASGGIRRAGGQPHLSFRAVSGSEDGVRPAASSSADVAIYVDLRAAMAAEAGLRWARGEKGDVLLTSGDVDGVVPRAFWTKVVARRADIGVLYEDGVVKKEVPLGLRGKGAKLKKGKGKSGRGGLKEMKGASSGEESSE